MEQTTQSEVAPTQWELAVGLIDANPDQPREIFDEDRLAELAASIASLGVLQPILVRPKEDGRYELVAGERRWRAAKAAGLSTVPAAIRDVPDENLRLTAVVENLHRENLNPLETAAAYQQLLIEHSLTHAELADLLHVDRSQVTRTLALLKLPEAVQRRVAAGVLSASHADALASLHDPASMELLARRIVAEGLSVAAVRELIAVGGLPGIEELDGRAEAARARRRRVPPPAPEHLRRAAEQLGDRLDTRVRVLGGKTRGRIVVDFTDRADLERILAVLVAGA